jgi:hypothetical protein
MKLEYRILPPPPALPLPIFTAVPKEQLGSDFYNDFELSAELKECDNYEGWVFWSFSVARGDFYSDIINCLRNHPQFYDYAIEVRIYFCDNDNYTTGIIQPQNVDDDCEEGCVLSVTPIKDTRVEECLMSQLIDNINPQTNFFAERPFLSTAPPPYQHPVFCYCKHNHYFLYTAFIVLFAVTVSATFGTALPIIAIGLILLLGGAGNVLDLFNNLRGCDEKVTAPFIRDLLENAAVPCGVTIDNTIHAAGSVYYNDCLFSLAGGEGDPLTNPHAWYSFANSLNWTMRDLLEFICKYYNGKFRLEGNVLKIRHKSENFNAGYVFDISSLQLCCNYNGDMRHNYGEYEHQRDEGKGNEALNLYDDIVQFNNFPNPNNRLGLRRQFDTAAVRFYDDGLGSNRISKIENSNVGGLIFSALISTIEFLSSLPFIGGDVKYPDPSGFVLLENGYTSRYKVISYDPATPLAFAKAVKKPYTAALRAAMQGIGYNIADNESKWNVSAKYYNYTQPVNEVVDAVCPNRFALFEIDNPRINKQRYQICTVERAACACEDLLALGIASSPAVGLTVLHQGTEYVIGRISITPRGFVLSLIA